MTRPRLWAAMLRTIACIALALFGVGMGDIESEDERRERLRRERR